MPILIIPLFLSFFMLLMIKFVIGLPLAMFMYGIFYVLEAAAAAGPTVI
jgi:fructose-specific phosphotransferase system IIC component